MRMMQTAHARIRRTAPDTAVVWVVVVVLLVSRTALPASATISGSKIPSLQDSQWGLLPSKEICHQKFALLRRDDQLVLTSPERIPSSCSLIASSCSIREGLACSRSRQSLR